MKNGNHRRHLTRLSSFFVISVFLLAVAALAIPFHSARSSSLPTRGHSLPSANAGSPPKFGRTVSRSVSNPAIPVSWSSIFKPFLPTPQPSPEGIATFNSDCVTPQTDFNLGDVVCAKATGVPVTLFPWHILWVDPAGFVRESDDASTDEATEYRYTLPSTPTSTVNDQTVDNRGTWRVNLARSSGAVRQTARFVVHEAANPVADVFIQKFARDNSSVSSGDNIAFTLAIGNAGPDAAAGVHLIDSIPAGATLVQFTQNSGPQCVEVVAGTPYDCIITTLTNGDSAEFTAIYNTGAAAPGDYSTSATVSTTTTETNTDNNTATAPYTVTASNGNATCQIICPDNVNATANTTEGGHRGAHVTYDDPVTSGDCGSVSSVPASGSFFPVGTTVVNVTSETGGGSCTFTITVEDTGTNPPTISCPANITANADGDCQAVVTIGAPTATGDNVTVVGVRSDGKPLYNCDCFPNSPNQADDSCNIFGGCSRKNPDAPFASGVTTITWQAISHSTPGPYTTPADEEAARTGTASCTQTITVNDVTPPVITATDSTVSADANCQAAVPDYSNAVSDNCACAANDTSQDCVGHHRISLTQDPAAGTMVGLGPHTIHLTANDGSSNNGGAGNTTTKDVTLTVADTTAPMITCPANIGNVPTEPGTCSAHVNPGTATATDNCDSNPAITGVRSDSQPLNATYPKGVTTITWTATDASGNHSSCQQTITVVDNEPPTISCPANLIVDFDPAVNGAVVTYTAPVGQDNCPGATTTQIAGLPSGSTFPTGTTTNTFKVTDASGNTAQCSFKVTVALTSLIGLDSVTITGSGYADSYNSSGGYPATKSSLVNVLSNGTITIGNSGKVWGNVRSTRANVSLTGAAQVTGNATAGTTVTTSGSASVGGTRTNNALAPVMTLPAVPACGPPYSSNSGISGTYSYNAGTGDLSLSGVNIATLANGNYCFHNVTLGNSSQLKVNGLVVIKLTGTLNTSGSSNLNNTTQIPSNLRILSSYSGSNGVVIGNSVSVYALIYSPQTGLNMSGSAPLFGTAAAKTLTIGNSGAIHYDTQLKSVWPDIWTLIFGP